MESKFATLLSIRSCLHSLDGSKDGIINLVQHLLDNDRGPTIISGIFRQLYWEGEKNSVEFYDKLLKCCANIYMENETKQNCEDEDNNTPHKPVCGEFEIVPDSLLCQIGSYLETSQIFNTFQHVNRRFFQMGMKPEIFIEWGYGHQYTRANCKFDIIPMLNKCKLKRFNLNKHNIDWCKKIDLAGMKSLQHVELGMCFVPY